jgi:hypothetical protein
MTLKCNSNAKQKYFGNQRLDKKFKYTQKSWRRIDRHRNTSSLCHHDTFFIRLKFLFKTNVTCIKVKPRIYWGNYQISTTTLVYLLCMTMVSKATNLFFIA